jgi:hypothetical protein
MMMMMMTQNRDVFGTMYFYATKTMKGITNHPAAYETQIQNMSGWYLGCDEAFFFTFSWFSSVSPGSCKNVPKHNSSHTYFWKRYEKYCLK